MPTFVDPTSRLGPALVAIVLAGLAAACGSPPETAVPGHEHEGPEISDLDRSVEDLKASTCEHEIPTWTCDECRYETGIVEVHRSLVDGGLLHLESTRTEAARTELRVNGEVQFDERSVAHVRPQVEGIVGALRARLGQHVSAGQPILEQDSREFDDARSAYLEARSLVDLADRALARLEQLRQDGITSEREVLQARHESQAAAIRARTARDHLERLGLSARDLENLDGGVSPDRLVLGAPIEGTLLFLDAALGEVVRPDDVLAIVGDTAHVRVLADLYEQDLAAAQRALAAGPVTGRVRVRAWPDEEFAGTVDLLGGALDEASRTVKLGIEVDNPDGRLKPGMYADVVLDLAGGDTAVTVPRGAVLEDEGRTFVFRHLEDDLYIRRPVRTGRAWADRIEVVEGLSDGVQIVTDGCFLLKSDVLRSKMGAGCAD